jgi:hypothetical protein
MNSHLVNHIYLTGKQFIDYSTFFLKIHEKYLRNSSLFLRKFNFIFTATNRFVYLTVSFLNFINVLTFWVPRSPPCLVSAEELFLG